MFPSLKDGDRVLIKTSNIGEIKRGDIIFFRHMEDETQIYFKRSIALSGEVVSIHDGKIFIANDELEEPYLDQTYTQVKGNFPSISVKEGTYYVLGDNRDNSSDSRNWGTVPNELIVGKYYATYWRAN